MLAESDSDSPLCSKTCRNWIMMVLSSSLCFLMTESFPLGVGNLEVRGGTREEQPQVQGVVAMRVQEGREELLRFQGQEGQR